MPFQKGNSGNPKGRKKGSLNKFPAQFKKAVEESFKKKGGVKYLVWLAEHEPRSYATILGKFLPVQVQAELETMPTKIIVISGVDAGPPGSEVG